MTWLICAVIGGLFLTIYTLMRGGPMQTAALLQSEHIVQGIIFSMVLGGLLFGTILWLIVMTVT